MLSVNPHMEPLGIMTGPNAILCIGEHKLFTVRNKLVWINEATLHIVVHTAAKLFCLEGVPDTC